MIKVTGIPAFNDNYIWLIGNEQKPRVAIVDPGDAQPVIEACKQRGLTPCAILITHHHWDHTNGIAELVARYPVPVYGPAHEKIAGLSHPLQQGDQVKLNEIDAQFTVLDTPGHTAGHICYYGHDSLFCGDTLFACGCGRLFEGTAGQMQQSLQKIIQLPDNTQVYCAHEYTLDNIKFARVAEPENQRLIQRQQETEQLRQQGLPSVPSLLGLEKQTNPFLRWMEPTLVTAAETFAGKPLTTPTEVFATVRRWKDLLD